jgi:uncharacterized protein (DUF2345 family)
MKYTAMIEVSDGNDLVLVVGHGKTQVEAQQDLLRLLCEGYVKVEVDPGRTKSVLGW